MRFLKLEHGKLMYYSDLCLYGTSVALWAGFLIAASPATQHLRMLGAAVLGFFIWGPLEYGLHRFVLHGIPPFKNWHAQHHLRPTALLCLPLWGSVTVLAGLVFFPALLSSYRWTGSALTWGLLAAYFFYALTHHALHHASIQAVWFQPYRYWHALHHASARPQPGRYGVTNRLWDRIFASSQ